VATDAAAKKRAAPVSAWAWALAAAPLVFLMLVVGLNSASNDHERLNCEASGTPITTQTGTLRRVSRQQMYVVNERWMRITLGCGGKYRLQCLRENPGVEALEQHVGEPVQVAFCGKHVVGYTVAGQTFRHGQLVGAGAMRPGGS
jgi:hypothetical protein